MQDDRTVHRNRTYLGGVITYSNHRSPLDCLVRNLSSDGSMILLPGDAPVPDEFDLALPRCEINCRAHLVWRTPDAAGVSFAKTASDNPPIPLSLGRRLKQLEAERDKYKEQVSTLLTLQSS